MKKFECLPLRPSARSSLMRLFSLFYDCAPVTVLPCHHGNLPSLLLVTHIMCVCRMQCSHSLIPLPCLHYKSVFEYLCAVCSMSMSEELLICGPSLTLSHSNTLAHTYCQIRAAAHRVVWSLAWELGWIRQTAAVWYSCHPLSTAGVAQHSLKFNQSPLASELQSTPTLDPWRPPFAPVTHAFSSHMKI